MPEGDTVWLAAQRMNQVLAGNALTRGELRVPQLAAVDLTGHSVTEVISRGKHMLFRFADGHTLRSHFRMEGKWHIQPAGRRWTGGPNHAIRAVLSTVDVDCLGFQLRDLAYVPTSEEDSLVGHLGPDLLGPDWDADEALRRLTKQPDAEVGVALLDQRNLAGIGTLYRTEGLFLGGIRPQRLISDLGPDALAGLVDRTRRLMLHNRERPQQSTTGSLRRGETLWVFERDGRPCRRCGTHIERGQQGPVAATASHVLVSGVPALNAVIMKPVERVPEPPDGDERSILIGWLAFHRNALEAKCAGLEAAQLVTRSAPPSPLSLLGLVRHLTEMERVYAVWALGPKADLQWAWGDYTDDGPEWDIDADESMLDESMAAWQRERRVADERIQQHAELESVGAGNGYSLRWNLQKLVGEYARHNGHADLVRERIDGQVGE